MFADKLVRPITVAHLIKTTQATFAEHARLGASPYARWPLLALARFAASPIRERPVSQLVDEAIHFVEHGKVPKTLT